MVSLSRAFEGFILAVILTVILSKLSIGTMIGFPISILGFLLAGIVIGYVSYDDILDGVVNGALMGVEGAIVLWILNLFTGEIASFSHEISSYVGLTTSPDIIMIMVIGAVGGFAGSMIKTFYKRSKRINITNRNSNDLNDEGWRD